MVIKNHPELMVINSASLFGGRFHSVPKTLHTGLSFYLKFAMDTKRFFIIMQNSFCVLYFRLALHYKSVYISLTEGLDVQLRSRSLA